MLRVISQILCIYQKSCSLHYKITLSITKKQFKKLIKVFNFFLLLLIMSTEANIKENEATD